ncbi:MAG: sigma-54-dependent Fis family transcriptional regulator [Pontiellaceae bacterium]|nr:sigma-54-dependent Fis family transcriptional regulator [Pontiellaceae bacterium]
MKSRILIVDDDNRHRRLYSDTLRQAGFEILEAIDGEDALAEISRSTPDLVVSDVRMPGLDGLGLLRKVRTSLPELPFLLVTAHADIRTAVNALKLGAVDYLEKPIDLDELIVAVSDALGLKASIETGNLSADIMQGIVAESPLMQQLFRDVHRVAATDASILLLGESGTGKEVIAQFIHRNSSLSKKPLVAVNCAAIPANLLASELFGHEKGSFTGATTRRTGHFREADGGTLFLDEIGDLPLELQPALLRALETGIIKPVGGDKEIRTNVRIVAATNHNLPERVTAGTFREDLYYRLNVITFNIPRLVDRPEDILPLARHFLPAGRRLSPAAARLLQNHSWPGNIRELANAMKRAAILSPTEIILPEHLPTAIKPISGGVEAQSGPTVVKTVERAEVEAIRSALQQTEGNRTRAAELLGISRRTLLYKIKRYELSPQE